MAIRWQGLEEDGQRSQLSFCVSEVLRGGWRSGCRTEYVSTHETIPSLLLLLRWKRLKITYPPMLNNSALQYFTSKILSIKVSEICWYHSTCRLVLLLIMYYLGRELELGKRHLYQESEQLFWPLCTIKKYPVYPQDLAKFSSTCCEYHANYLWGG